MPFVEQGKWQFRARILREILISIGGTALLFAGAYWLISVSPIAKPVSIADSAGIILGAATLSIFVVTSLSYLSSILSTKRAEEGSSSFDWKLAHLENERITTRKYVARIAVMASIGGTTLLFAFSFWIVIKKQVYKPVLSTDWSGSLLTAASLSLFVFSSLIAVFAIFGWRSLIEHIDNKVKDVSEAKFLELQKDTQGRFLSVMGYTMGELNLVEDTFEAKDMNRMAVAIEHCRRGYEHLKDSPTGPRLMALNNYVFYLCLKKDPSNGPWLIKQALELREAGQKFRVARLMLTYCQVIARYSRDLPSRRLAFNLVKHVQTNFPLDPQEQKEAQYCLSLFKNPDLPYELEDL